MDQKSISEILVSDHDIRVDGNSFSIPVSLQTLKNILGNTPAIFKGKYNTVYTWHDLGIRAYSNDKVNVQAFGLDIVRHKKYNFTPLSLYTGKLKIGDQDYTTIKVQRKDEYDDSMEITLGVNHVFIDLNDSNEIASIEISQVKQPEPIEDPDRYKFTPVIGEKIEFKDFNFKLAVIQVLMYEKELLKPAFDIFEFAKRYRQREIDVDEEGYDIIPEVKKYFENLEIDRKYADEITEIIQDGGNDIYMNMIAFWSGEDDVFNIRSFEDTVHFKNLKKVELFYDENIDTIREELRAKGISAELY
jgi:hypothetical protein